MTDPAAQIDLVPSARSPIGMRFQACRQRAGLTQQQIADRIAQVPDAHGRLRDLTRAAYAQWELGLTTPDVERVRAAAEVLGVAPSHLAFGEPGGEEAADNQAVRLTEWNARLADVVGSGWAVSREWLDRLGMSADDLRLVRAPDDVVGTDLSAGTVVIVETRTTSVAAPGVYVYATQGRLGIAAMAPRASSGSHVVVRSGPMTYDEAAADLDIRGRIVSAWVRVT